MTAKNMNKRQKSNRSKRTKEELWKRPLLQTRVRRLKESNLVVHQTIITTVRPIEYYEAVVDRENQEMETSVGNVIDEPGDVW